MKIENEYILKNILTNGINIFAGAGFSRLCKHNENCLPTENELLEEVKRKFPTVKEFDTLPDVSEILNALRQRLWNGRKKRGQRE